MGPEEFLQLIGQGKRIACFGSRETPGWVSSNPNGTGSQPIGPLRLMIHLGKLITEVGSVVQSGHADGADLAFEFGANLGDPRNMVVCLPWRSYNSQYSPGEAQVFVIGELLDSHQAYYMAEAEKYHPAWKHLKQPVRLLMARNMMIANEASCGLTYLNHSRQGGGGSGHAYRALTARGVPVVDFSSPEIFLQWEKYFLKGETE